MVIAVSGSTGYVREETVVFRIWPGGFSFLLSVSVRFMLVFLLTRFLQGTGF
jgi:hypothetical protein